MCSLLSLCHRLILARSIRHFMTLHDIECMSTDIARRFPGRTLVSGANELSVTQSDDWLPVKGPLSAMADSRRPRSTMSWRNVVTTWQW